MRLHRYLGHNIFASLVGGAFKDGFLAAGENEDENEDEKYARIAMGTLPFLNKIKSGNKHPLTGRPSTSSGRAPTSLSEILRSARSAGRNSRNVAEHPPYQYDHDAVEKWTESVRQIDDKTISKEAYLYSVCISDRNEDLKKAGRFGKVLDLSSGGEVMFAQVAIQEEVSAGDIVEYAHHYFCRISSVSGNAARAFKLNDPIQARETLLGRIAKSNPLPLSGPAGILGDEELRELLVKAANRQSADPKEVRASARVVKSPRKKTKAVPRKKKKARKKARKTRGAKN